MSSNRTMIMLSILIACLVIPAGLGVLVLHPAMAKGDNPPSVAQPNEPEVVVPGAIPIQGRITDASGTPLNGTYSLVFRLYEVESGGVALCTDTNSVLVTDGLFDSYIDNCYNDLWGQKVWFSVQVTGDEEMAPRMPIYPVPYAITIRPGAVISGTVDNSLVVVSRGAGDYDALSAYAYSSGEALTATSDDGIGVLAYSTNSLAVQGYSFNAGGVTHNPGIYGCVGANSAACDAHQSANSAGVLGYSAVGPAGVTGLADTATSFGLLAYNSGGGASIGATANSADTTNHYYPTLYLAQMNSAGDFVVGANSYYGTRYWRVDRTGRGFFNGGTQASGADFAEQMQTDGEAAAFEPGDVLVISAQGDALAALSSEPFAATVLGVYSTQPALLAGAPDTDEPLDGIPVAIVGIVACKVTAENGPIQRGDLLVTSSTPGYAMRAGTNPPQGTVLGKALQPLEEGAGLIQILVTLQ